MTPQERAARQRRSNGGGLLDFGMGVGNVAKGTWDNMNTLQKVGMAPIPVVSDIAGLLGDVQMMYEQPEERTLANAAFAALGALPFVPSVAGITTWHGSPHKWDKVDLDKVGTGEGAQAYGHGFYSAQNKNVAEDYKAMTPAADIRRSFLKELPEDADFDDLEELLSSGHFNANQESVIKALQEDDWLGFDYPSQAISAAYTDIDNYNPSPALKSAVNNSGNMYKLDIDDKSIDTMLDWDKPLSEQSSKLQDLALESGVDVSKTGGEFYRQIAFGNKPTMAASRGQKAASGLLNDAGIKGIKYLDGNSRGANKGTSNYVNFDANDVNVVSRNGDPIPDDGLLGGYSRTNKPTDVFENETRISNAGNTGNIDIAESQWSPTKYGITNFLVDEGSRGKGIGGGLLDEAIADYGDELSGAFSSKESLAAAYNRGFRGLGSNSDLDLQGLEKVRQADSSVTMKYSGKNGDPIPDEGLLGIKPEKGPDSFSGSGLLGRSDDADTFDYPPAENAGKTQIAGTKPTYEKAAKILDESAPKGKSIDYGAGLGVGAGAIQYDTFEPFPKAGFKPNFTSPEKIPSDTYSRLTNLNVLNVVPKEARDSIVKDIGRVLKPKGQAIITTRGADVMKAKGKAGPEPTSIITTIGTYQKGFKRGELVEYLQETLGNGFDVEPLGLGPAGAKITKKGN